VAPPAGVRWFDVDRPEVIALRRKLYSESETYQMVGSSVTDPGWLDHLPAGGPVLIVAEGLLMYLTTADVYEFAHRHLGHSWVNGGRIDEPPPTPSIHTVSSQAVRVISRPGHN
jgi:O-methyltransferase involved in polyketide biosynthesis